MMIVERRALRGPNLRSDRPLLEVRLGETEAVALEAAVRLLEWVPGLGGHRCWEGPGGRLADRARSGLAPGPLLEHLALELLALAGHAVEPVRDCRAAEPDWVLVPYEEEAVGCLAFEEAWRLVRMAIDGEQAEGEIKAAVAGAVRSLHDLAERVTFGPNSKAILRAARRRGIPARRLSAGSLVLLGQGVRQRRIRTSETDNTSAVAKFVSFDKALTKSLLQAIGVPVSIGRAVSSPEEAWLVAQAIGPPVAVKPLDSFHGRGVSLGLVERSAIEAAFELARREGTGVLVERFAPGAEHRLLIVAGQLVAAARGDAAYVTGDGRQTIAELIESQLNSDPRRGTDARCPLNPVRLGTVIDLELAQAGLGPSSVPRAGERVLIQRKGNHGQDVTDDVHPEVIARAVEAARVVGLDIAGIDIVAEDISRPLEEQGGVIVEVNEGPGLDIHLMPGRGQPRPVGEAIIASLFPEDQDGRIPIVAVTGEAGPEATAAARELARLLTRRGRVVGLASSAGLFVRDRCLRAGDQAHAQATLDLLLYPFLDVAIIEVVPERCRAEGLGLDQCDVLLITRPAGPSPVSTRPLKDPIPQTESLLGRLLTSQGWIVRPAETAPEPTGTESAPAGPRTVLYDRRPDSPELTAHRRRGGPAAWLDPVTSRIVTDPVASWEPETPPSAPLDPLLAATAALLALTLPPHPPLAR